jgi:signal transduction histidine kinase
LSLKVAQQQLYGEIRDDGRGFEASSGIPAEPVSTNGQGLENMKRRAAHLGGQVQIDSSPGSGVSVRLKIPLKHR